MKFCIYVRYVFLLLTLVFFIGVVSATSEEVVTTQGLCWGGGPIIFTDCRPGSALRYDPAEDTFSGIRNGDGTDFIQYPYYTTQLLAGTTNNKFTNMSRSTLVFTSVSMPGNAIIRGAFLEFNATTYSDMGDFSVGITSATIDSIMNFDQDDYQKFGDLPLAENITITSNGLHHINFTISDDGMSYINASEEVVLNIRLGWDINGSFDGAWASGGNTTLFVNETHDGRQYWWHDRARLHITFDAPPTASFSCAPTVGTSPLGVSCTDSSTYNPENWSWVSTNGETSTDQNPTFTYSSVGEYGISLTACNNIGCDTKNKPYYISVREPRSNIRGTISILNTTSWAPLGGDVVMRNTTGAIYTGFIDNIDGDDICTVAWSTDDGYSWNTSSTFAAPSASSLNLMVDASDKVSMTYQSWGGDVNYRNYTLSGGFGDPVIVSSTAIEWSSTIDSHGTVYLAYDEGGGIGGSYKVTLINMSATHVLGQPITLADGVVPWWPKVMVDTDDNVHVVWGEDGIGLNGEGIMYRNFTYGGEMGDLIQMSDTDYNQYPLSAIIDSSNKIHILYAGHGWDTIEYVNASPSTSFLLSDPVTIGGYDGWSPTMAFDTENTLHFIISSDGIKYLNLSTNGFSHLKTIDTNVVESSLYAIYNLAVPGNVPDNEVEYVVTISDPPGYRVVYGVYPHPELAPTPTPNPFNTVTMESTAQTVQMIITLGILLSILAIVGMLVMRFIAPPE